MSLSRGAESRRIHAIGIMLLTFMALVVGACGPHDSQATPSGLLGDGGPLWVNVGGGGGVSVAAPPEPRWWSSFGSFRICTPRGRPAVLGRLTYTATVKPLAVHILVREVSDAERRTPRGERITTPFYSAKGQAPKFAEPYARLTLAGTFSSRLAGTRVKHDCSKLNDEKAGFTELVVTMESDGAGAVLRDFRLEYSVGTKRYVRKIDYTVVACGQRTPQFCSSSHS